MIQTVIIKTENFMKNRNLNAIKKATSFCNEMAYQ